MLARAAIGRELSWVDTIGQQGHLKSTASSVAAAFRAGAPAARDLDRMPSYDSVAQQLSGSLQPLLSAMPSQACSKLGAPARQGAVDTMRSRYAA